ncbi:hypothetical protein [Mycolicibacterium peregrinum]|uniref:DUF4760 domain-containing protein n=1 Tax=Mycolicibacterium peregrinum TaxID=43304 RepID=A0A4Z0HW92_MYCPR|nr:hypothetical protein [Mycolicibacterium peregrinum]TGB36974.1 hypothetical protein EJD98_28080 [Mycolicibacterium peregrinum]TGB46592.1 hypothetical protein EJD94_06590 [Mycolicibacterium peregrinum]
MSTTPLWLALLVAALSPAGALFGVWLTQRRADRRDDATFSRELKRERERWQREDEARTFENRRVAYVEFYEAVRRMHVAVEDMALGHSEALSADWQTDAWEKLQHLTIYGTLNISYVAARTFRITLEWGHRTAYRSYGADEYSATEVEDAKAELLQAIRTDLRVPDTAELTRTNPINIDQNKHNISVQPAR